jgi:hypothetical protein
VGDGGGDNQRDGDSGDGGIYPVMKCGVPNLPLKRERGPNGGEGGGLYSRDGSLYGGAG